MARARKQAATRMVRYERFRGLVNYPAARSRGLAARLRSITRTKKMHASILNARRVWRIDRAPGRVAPTAKFGFMTGLQSFTRDRTTRVAEPTTLRAFLRQINQAVSCHDFL